MNTLVLVGSACEVAGLLLLAWDLRQTQVALAAFHRRGRMGFNFPGPDPLAHRLEGPTAPERVVSQQQLREEMYDAVRQGIGFTMQELQREWIQPLVHTFLETVEGGLRFRWLATGLILVGLALSVTGAVIGSTPAAPPPAASPTAL